MRIVVVGGSGLIGDKVMTALDTDGHLPVAASPAFGIDAFTGEGLDAAMAGAEVVVDVSNAPGYDDDAIRRFFETVTANALKAGRRAGVRHHVVLSVLGCDRLPESGYLRAKVAQEELVRAAGVPYTIVRSAQFMEALPGLGARVPDTRVQPIAAHDTAGFVCAAATGAPAGGVVEVAGPDAMALAEAVQEAARDGRRVVADPDARYFGAPVPEGALLPGPGAQIATTTLAEWLARSGAVRA